MPKGIFVYDSGKQTVVGLRLGYLSNSTFASRTGVMMFTAA